MQNTGNLGFLGFGVAAFNIAKGLQLENMRAGKKSPWDAEGRAKAETAGVTHCDTLGEVVEGSDIVFALVPPDVARDVALSVAPQMSGKCMLDLTVAAPQDKVAAADAVVNAGGSFVDGAIMGPLMAQGHQVSTLISGPEADSLAETLVAWDMGVRAVGDKVGLASTVKMVRSVYTKGVEAVVQEFSLAAERAGATDLALESLEEIIELAPFHKPLREMVSELILEQVDHAARRANELEQVVRTLEDMGIEPAMAKGALKRYRIVSDDVDLNAHFKDKPPADYHEVMRYLDENS